MAIDEMDLLLVHALQLAPRAPWSEVSEATGLDASTAARRWRTLLDSGMAWTTVAPGNDRVRGVLAGGTVEVHCRTDAIDTLAEKIAMNPLVLSVEKLSHRCELLLEVVGFGMSHLSQVAHEQIVLLADVEHVRLAFATDLFGEGGSWQLDALSPVQQRKLRRFTAAPTGERPPRDEVTAQIAAVLRDDVRASAADVARQLGWSESSARRRLERVLTTQALRLRVDLAQPVTGFPLTVTSWFSVEPAELASIGPRVAALRNTRICAGLTGGPANLLVGSWLRSTQDITSHDIELAAILGGARLVDRALTTRTFKRAARLLNPDGSQRGLVAVDL